MDHPLCRREPRCLHDGTPGGDLPAAAESSDGGRPGTGYSLLPHSWKPSSCASRPLPPRPRRGSGGPPGCAARLRRPPPPRARRTCRCPTVLPRSTRRTRPRAPRAARARPARRCLHDRPGLLEVSLDVLEALRLLDVLDPPVELRAGRVRLLDQLLAGQAVAAAATAAARPIAPVRKARKTTTCGCLPDWRARVAPRRAHRRARRPARRRRRSRRRRARHRRRARRARVARC
jgi:hypothetical protein